MVKFEIIMTQDAIEDLNNIRDYYLLHFSIESAEKVIKAIQKRIAQLADFPNSGSTPPSNWLASHAYKMVITGKYATIYHLYGSKVYIYAVVNTQQDYPKLFEQYPK
ncbi:type II toxin-antitoxin system RelE/ParE family toxin [Limosilactobacillus urinaemulieris]|uniref:type II toxin-antitoxin system RelE/ParE family toxin n=1 Tax=Limosilactobacillus urinaemulieris TaxID=2742600 RepID=UPI0028EB3137|nr:type II toxin-antitoxin system RelE/ParE family toxin [Limosilactobacillus urinaemulieris]